MDYVTVYAALTVVILINILGLGSNNKNNNNNTILIRESLERDKSLAKTKCEVQVLCCGLKAL